MELKAATSALRQEAGVWDQQADEMAIARAKIAAMELGMIEAGVFMPLVLSYNDLVNQLQERCDEGTTSMHQVGETLRSVADQYERTDEQAAVRV